MMYKLLIVDDEEIVRKGLSKIVELSESGFEVAGEADHGPGGVELAASLNPDLIIVDIKMPGMNGLEMVDRIKQTQPDLKFIILSAYTDFDFTRRAIQSGAVDYLKKPVNRYELIALLKRIKLEIDREKEALQKKDRLLELSNEFVGFKEKFLSELLEETDFLPEQMQKKLDVFGIGINVFTNCLGVIIRIDNFSRMNFQAKEEAESFQARILGFCYSHLSSLGKTEIFCRKENELVGLIFFPSNEEKAPSDLRECLEKVLSFGFEDHDFSLTIGVGSIQDSVLKLAQSIQDACRAVKAGFYAGKGRIFFPSEITEFEKPDYQVLMDKQKQLMDNLVVYVMSGDSGKVNQSLEELMAEFERGVFAPEVVIKFWNSLLEYLTWNLKRNGYYIPGIEPDLGFSETWADLKNQVMGYVAEIITAIISLKGQGERRVVEVAKEFIISHFAGDLNLEMVARHIHMNTNYFSSLFKKETGKNFIDFLTEIRIEKAKELLRRMDLKIYDICREVGYYSPKHFSRLFKQTVGMTPLEYRNKIK